MIYQNTCPINLTNIDSETACLVKVPYRNTSTYFYIRSYEDLLNLTRCPYTRETGDYYYVTIASADISLLELNSQELKSTMSDLTNVDAELTWHTGNFTAQANNRPIAPTIAETPITRPRAASDANRMLSRQQFIQNFVNQTDVADEEEMSFTGFFTRLMHRRNSS